MLRCLSIFLQSMNTCNSSNPIFTGESPSWIHGQRSTFSNIFSSKYEQLKANTRKIKHTQQTKEQIIHGYGSIKYKISERKQSKLPFSGFFSALTYAKVAVIKKIHFVSMSFNNTSVKI